MEYKDLWKSKPAFSLKNILTRQSQVLNAERNEKRKEFFWASRVAESVSDEPQPLEKKKKKNPRAEMLLKWKAEKKRKLEEEKAKQKPAFKVGIMQKKSTGSPMINSSNSHLKKNFEVQHTKPKANNIESKKLGILTRAKAKHMDLKLKMVEADPVDKPQKSFSKCYKYEEGKKKPIDTHVFKVPEAVSKLPCSGLTFCFSPKVTKRCRKSLRLQEKDKIINIKQVNLEAAKTEHSISETQVKHKLQEGQVEPEKEITENVELSRVDEQIKNKLVESFQEVATDSQPCNTISENDGVLKDDYIPIHYSPFVTVRSGKKSKRKSKKSLTIDVDEQIKKEEAEFKCRIFSFRKFIDCESNRLLMECKKWKHIYQEFQEVPTDVEEDIDSIVGKTNLLTSDKFMQFKGLIDKCENGDPLVKVDDLQGFQDWVSIEVERIDLEFHKLEKRKCNNWKSETTTGVVAQAQKAKVVKNVTKKIVGKSSIRSHILAARKLLKEGNANGGEAIQLPTATLELVKATTPKKKQSLLKDVLTSETKKSNLSFSKKSPVVREKRNSGLEIMIASQKNKLPTPAKLQKSPCLTDFEILIGKEDTPSKSILKKVPKTLSTPKGHVTFENVNENTTKQGRGLSEKYFRPVTKNEMSPMRTVLGDLGNLSANGMSTRSKAKQLLNQQMD